MTRRVRLRIRGGLQGVNFRWYASQEARRLGVAGWIRNSGGRDVEAVAEGDDAAIEAFVAWCRHGPPAARVAEVEFVELPGRARYRDFAIVREALGD